MNVPAPVSRFVLVVAVLMTLGLVWSAWPTIAVNEVVAPMSSAPRAPATTAPRLTLAVDATDLPRGLLRSTVAWDVHPGRLWLRFPQWLQGTHAPCGAIENITGLVFHDHTGAVVPWSRDPLDAYRFAVDVPVGCTRLTLDLVYLANQPTTNSQPIDVLANADAAAVNWNNCLLYPEGWSHERIQITASLKLPPGWREACALDSVPCEDGIVDFEPTDLQCLIDSPVLCGRHLTMSDIAVVGFPSHRLAIAATQAQPVPRRALDQLQAVAAEARELFGGAPFARYTWLLGVGQKFPHLGLEHLSSSLNGISQDEWCDGDGLNESAAFLLTHEYAHAWCGKHHRPAGMVSTDCHTRLDTRLLWVYEGFDQYLGYILAARAGATSRENWLKRLVQMTESVYENRSRTWRTLEDTASVSYTLRKRSANWGQRRGGQDYYLEGMLLCLHADGLIRRASHGARSFDDVARRFLAPRAGATVVPYNESDVLAILREVEPSINWPGLIDHAVRRTRTLPDDATLAAWGMHVTWVNTRPADANDMPARLDDIWSIGLTLWNGHIVEVRPGSPADQARIGLSEIGESIASVNGQPLQLATWDAALRSNAPIQLCLLNANGDERTVSVVGVTGPRYLRIAPSTEPADRAILDAIIAPRSNEGAAVRASSGGW